MKFFYLKCSENQHLSEKHTWFDFTHGISHMTKCEVNLEKHETKQCLLYLTTDSNSYLSREATVYVCVWVCEGACVHACMWMCVSVWVYACKFGTSPRATPTHSHVSHSLNEKDPARQSNFYPNWYDCRLAVFILVFTDLYAYWTWLRRR